MPFHYLLSTLLSEVPGAIGAILLDEEGESVECVTRHNSPYEVKVEGAYHSVFKRKLSAPLESVGGGSLLEYHLVGSSTVTITRSLPDGYYVVLILGRDAASPAVASFHLKKVSSYIAREIAG